MDFQAQLNNALAIARSGQFDGCSDEDIKSMISVLQRYISSQAYPPAVPLALQSFEKELARRQVQRGQAEAKAHHEEHLKETKGIHARTEDMIEEQRNLRDTFLQLTRPRWIDWAILFVSLIAAAASVIGYWPQIVAAFRGLLHVF